VSEPSPVSIATKQGLQKTSVSSLRGGTCEHCNEEIPCLALGEQLPECRCESLHTRCWRPVFCCESLYIPIVLGDQQCVVARASILVIDPFVGTRRYLLEIAQKHLLFHQFVTVCPQVDNNVDENCELNNIQVRQTGL
jgi:hypothetical protein